MGRATEKESVSIAATASAAVAPGAESVAALLGPSGLPSLADAPGAGGAGAGGPGPQASLQALVGVMNAGQEDARAARNPGAAGKAKAKAKAKARVTAVTTKTPAEIKNSIRLSDAYNMCSSLFACSC